MSLWLPWDRMPALNEECGCIRVTVTLQGHLPWYAPEEDARHSLGLPAGSTAASVIQALGVPHTEVLGFSVCGKMVSADHRLEHRDCVEVIPVVSGG